MYAGAAIMGFLPATADSARVVEHAYGLSLSILAPVGVAALAAIALRKAQAATRAAVWKATVLAVLVVYVGGLLPGRSVAWIIPAGLASPLIALGRMQVGAPLATLLAGERLAGSTESLTVRLLFVVYAVGVAAVAIPIALATVRLSGQSRRAIPVTDVRVARLLAGAIAEVGIHRRVRLLTSHETSVPITWGTLRPVILLPPWFMDEREDRLRAVLLHELNHVQTGDAAYATISRLACAALWFHPAMWWLDRRLRADCEAACDDRVLATGVRQSDYAELLVDACDRLHDSLTPRTSMAICQRAGLRERLGAILDPARDRRRSSRFAGALAMSLTIGLAVPASMLQLAPTKSVLSSLMQDQRWESRAYAVMGLAQRPDSIEVARSAASLDPDPKVRAWARYAVSLELAAQGPGNRVTPGPTR